MIKEIKGNLWVYLLLVIILAGALFVRVYRIDQLLGFYYDQGRDASVIWKLLYESKFFLIGPVTGIEGIFRGPWYYWLITPFYFLGQGNPIWPSVFLAFLSVVAIFLLFQLAYKTNGLWASFVAVIIASFSFNLVLSSRWLSNPTPMLIISMLLIFFMFFVLEGKKWAWLPIAFLLGMAMQFGSATEIFYFPAVLIFGIWQRRNLPGWKTLLLLPFIILIAFAPQIIFDIRHAHVLLGAIKKFLITDESFKVSFWEVAQSRLILYRGVFLSKLFPTNTQVWMPFLFLAGLSLFINAKTFFKNKRFITVLLVLASPLLGMIFFQGNYGNVYDHYFTGYYLVFVLVFSVLISHLAKKTGGIIIFIFLVLFLVNNLPILRNYLIAGADGPTHITLGNEVQSVEWVLNDSQGRGRFNVDTYVPPVIPHSYDYLFLWRATEKCGSTLCGMVLDQQVPVLYTLYEVDPPHPERLDVWLARQEGIGVVDQTVRFGGITVERRHRIDKKTMSQ